MGHLKSKLQVVIFEGGPLTIKRMGIVKSSLHEGFEMIVESDSDDQAVNLIQA